MGKQQKRPKVSTVMDANLQQPPTPIGPFKAFDSNNPRFGERHRFVTRDGNTNYVGNFNESNTLDYNDYAFKNKVIDRYKKNTYQNAPVDKFYFQQQSNTGGPKHKK